MYWLMIRLLAFIHVQLFNIAAMYCQCVLSPSSTTDEVPGLFRGNASHNSPDPFIEPLRPNCYPRTRHIAAPVRSDKIASVGRPLLAHLGKQVIAAHVARCHQISAPVTSSGLGMVLTLQIAHNVTAGNGNPENCPRGGIAGDRMRTKDRPNCSRYTCCTKPRLPRDSHPDVPCLIGCRLHKAKATSEASSSVCAQMRQPDGRCS